VAERHYPLPNGPDAFFDVGRFFEEAQQHDKAAAYYLRSLELAPTDDTTHYHLGLCRYRQGDHPGAVTHFEAAVRSNPRAVLARGWIAQIAAETPQPVVHG
jgi:tetratricopeptide (TPR) repeat protein